MIAGQQNTPAALQRDPASGFGTLARFVDHDPIERAIPQHHVVNRRRGANHVGAVEHVVDRLPLESAQLPP